MKKFLPAFLVLLTVLCGMLGFAACEEKPTAHTEHTFGEWATVKEATCAEEGLRERTCTECAFKDTEVIPVDSTAHKWDGGTVTASATCTTPGVKTFHCTLDSAHTKTEEVPIDKDAHEWDNGTVTTPATCTTPGVKTFHCALDSTHTKTEEVPIDKDAHEWDNGTVTTPATCKEPGVKTFHCVHDDAHTRTEVIAVDAEAHIWDEKSSSSGEDGTHTLVCKLDPTHVRKESCTYLDSVVEPTCDDPGYTEHVCIFCNYSKQDTPTAALGHRYTLIAPDPENPGKHILTCANDPNHTKSETCELTVQTIEPGCETPGYTVSDCARCGYHAETNMKEAEGHAWGPWEQMPGTNNHIKHCTKDPNHTSTAACDFDTTVTKPTCTADGFTTYKCKDCPNTYTDDVITSPGHQYQLEKVDYASGSDVHQHKQVCSVCSDSTLIDCVFSQTTLSGSSCDESGTIRHTCINCANFYDETVAKLGHDWGNFVSDGQGHHTHTCQRANCQKEETFPCSLKVTEQHQATCTADAYDVKVCSEPSCNYNVIEQHPETKTGHDYESAKAAVKQCENKTHEVTCGNGCGEKQTFACTFDNGEVTKPTCTAKGYTTFTCPVCKAHYQDNETDMVAHEYGGWTPVAGYSAENKMHEHSCLSCKHKEQVACTGFTYRTTDATCTAEGQTLQVCDACTGETVYATSSKLDHAFGSWISNHDGTHYQECIHCKHQEKRTCELKTVSKNATCTEFGSIDEMCELCGYVKDGEDLPALGHNYTGTTWTYDSGNPGNHYRTCTVCGHKDSAACVIETVTTNSTCMTGAVQTNTCSFCSHEETNSVGSPLGCDYIYTDNGNGTHTRTCRRGELCDNSESRLENIPCDYKSVKTEATCTADAYITKTCSACQYTVVEVSEHTATGHHFSSYSSNHNGTHTSRCDNANCDATEDVDCTYDEIQTIEPTCNTEGYTLKTCSKCRYTISVDTTQRKPHVWGTEYTSTQNGKHHLTCTNSGCTAIQETNCNYNTVNHEATCTQAPYTTYSCQNCSYSYNETTGSKLEHSWQVKTAATAQSHGRTHTLICTQCSTEKEELCSDLLEETPASCTAPAHHKHTCLKCNSVYEHDEGDKIEHRWSVTPGSSLRSEHTKTCSTCGTSVSEPCTGKATRVQKPTCTESGYTVYTCNVCQGTYTADTTPAKGHSIVFRVWYESVGTETHYRQCPDCGLKETGDCVYETRQRTDPTCTKKGSAYMVCSKCPRSKTETLPALGHQYPDTWVKSTDGKQHYRLCERENCGYRNVKNCELVPINESEVYCNAPGFVGLTCKACGYMNSAAQNPVEHKWSTWAYDGNGNHSRYCTRVGCNVTQQGECTIEETKTELSCATPESTTRTCNTCGFTETHITQPARGHDWRLTSTDTVSHNAECDICHTKAVGEHDFGDSNLCSVCKYDGLNYALCKSNGEKLTEKDIEDNIQPAYCIVENDNRVLEAEHIIVPEKHKTEKYGELTVKAIGKHAFVSNSNLQTVVLPGTIIEIMECAFSNCKNLTSVTFAEGAEIELEEINYGAFGQSSKLQEFPLDKLTKLTKIGDNCFTDCTAFKGSKVPDTVTSIGTSAFKNSGIYLEWEKGNADALFIGKHLIRLRKTYSAENGAYSIPADTLSVGASAFEDCTGLTSLTIYAATKYFDVDAFKGCSALATLKFEGTLAQWLAITFKNDLASPLHFVSEFTIEKVEDNPEIPDDGSVVAIPAGTFRNSKTLTTITIPDKITSIGARAFEGCENLATIVLPDTVTYIGEDAFKGCTALFAKPENHENGGFYIGNHLISVDNSQIPENGEFAVRKGTVTISPNAFKDCVNLKKVTIPESVKWIGAHAFTDCTNLSSVTFEGNDPGFFATHRLGIGRWLDGDIIQGSAGAQNLKADYPYEWRRVK